MASTTISPELTTNRVSRMIVTVASPDKLSIRMFLSFMMAYFKNDCLISTVQSLWSMEYINKHIDDLLRISTGRNVIVTYYAKKEINVNPIDIIPPKIISASDIVIWMDLYSVDWEVIKDSVNLTKSLIENWKRGL